MKKDKLEKGIKKRRVFLKICIFIIFIALAVTFALKSEYFTVKNVVVKDNKYVETKEVTGMVSLKDKNIFIVRGSKIKDLLSNNPYIEDISLKKKLPDTIEIYVKEKQIRGLVKFKDGFINIDSNGGMVQIVNQFPGKDLPLIEGVKIDQYVPGECIIKKDDIKVKALIECLRVSNINEVKSRIYSINITDVYNIIFQSKDGIEIRVGDWNNLEYKLSYALSILNSNAVKGSKGYIEIQPEGTAIFKKTQ